MTALTAELIRATLARVRHPSRDGDLVSLDMIGGIVIRGDHVGFAIEAPPGEAGALEPLRAASEAAVRSLAGVGSCTVVLTAERAPDERGVGPAESGRAPAPAATGHRHPPGPAAPSRGPTTLAVPGVRAIIAVASGKGGVGKSTTAVNLALALQSLGRRVGLLDADIYGPSIPRMTGLRGQPTTADGKRMNPLRAFGMPVMSIGFLVEEDTPMIWRGPMVQSALQQMLGEVAWGELDILVVDLPPGTGDAQLTMAQRVPLAGAVIVSTPQDIALLDARKAIGMFNKVNVPILGVVENMSYFCCPACGHRSEIFAHGGARDCAAKLGVPFLGEVPLDLEIRIRSDDGRPITVTMPDGPQARVYGDIALGVLQALDGAAVRPMPRIRYV